VPNATDAYEKIRPSVVAVRGAADDGEEGTQGMETGKQELQRGTGVVIVDSGLILTNLHVVAGARRVHVTSSTAPIARLRWSARARSTTWRCCRQRIFPTT
jgi:S1-C subfamily serine protease